MVRASVFVEKLGIPSASVVCRGFELQGSTTAAGWGMPNLPMAVYPGPVNLHSVEELQKNVETVLVDQVIRALTVQPQETRPPTEPEPGDIVFNGTFEQVNRFFYESEWSDGLPIVPPTREKVEEFLRHTSRPADQVIGVLLPEKREAPV